eukprot:g3771.t1
MQEPLVSKVEARGQNPYKVVVNIVSTMHTRSLTAVLALAAAAAAARAAPLNVLFLSVDDLRYEIDCIPMPGTVRPAAIGLHTPNICALANESLVLERSQVAMSTCAPSRAAMITGRHAGSTRVWDLYSYWRNVSGNFTTIPQYFKDEGGYHSVGMGKIFHPGAASGDGAQSDGPCPTCRGGDDQGYSWSVPCFHGKDPINNCPFDPADPTKTCDA